MPTATATITPETTYVAETLVTDTVIYQIVGRTARTLTIRATRDGAVTKRDNIGGNPYPVVFIAAEPDPGGAVFTVRLRKDGTYRLAGGRPLRPVVGDPVRRVDYRY